MKDLTGDRAIEWAFIERNMPVNCKVLDIGCAGSILYLTALRYQNRVTGIDLVDFSYVKDPHFKFIHSNFLTHSFNFKFDFIICCSTIEHVGLAGRYGSPDVKNGDILAMRKIQTLMTPESLLALTIPIGIDDTFTPAHRVYGTKRLPLLLDEFNIDIDEYYHKDDNSSWKQIDSETARTIQGSSTYYALGLFILSLK